MKKTCFCFSSCSPNQRIPCSALCSTHPVPRFLSQSCKLNPVFAFEETPTFCHMKVLLMINEFDTKDSKPACLSLDKASSEFCFCRLSSLTHSPYIEFRSTTQSNKWYVSDLVTLWQLVLGSVVYHKSRNVSELVLLLSSRSAK